MKLFKGASLLLLGTLSISFIGCNKSDGPGSDPEPKDQLLTPKEQKARLNDIGIRFTDAIDSETHENLVEVAAYMDEEGLGDFDIDEAYLEKLENLYTETGYDEYRSVARKPDPIKAIQGLMNLSLDAAQSGTKLATRADDIYIFTLEAGLKDLYGGFKPDMYDEVWVYDKSITDRLEVEFTDDHNQKWVATLKGSKETTRIHLTCEYKYYEEYISSWGNSVYDDHEKYDIAIDVPEKITLSVACNDKKVIDMTVNSSLAFEGEIYENCEWSENYYTGYYNHDHEYDFSIDYKNLNLDATLNVNGYTESWKVKASKSNINTSAEVKINGKSMMKAEATLNADIDAIIKQANDAANEDSDDDIEFNPGVFKDFSMKLDVMGEVQIAGKCAEFEELYDAILDIDEAYEYEDFKKFERKVNQLNEFYNITLHYDNSKTVQAHVELEAYEDVYEDYYEEYTDYYVRPILVFAIDDSRYCFEDYFTEKSFNDLIGAVEDLADDFEDMFESYF